MLERARFDLVSDKGQITLSFGEVLLEKHAVMTQHHATIRQFFFQSPSLAFS